MLLTLFTIPIPAADAFDQANKLYEQGKYADAAGAYEKLLQSGTISPAIYFNLGNALFKAGQTGRAVYYYRLAERLAPRDPDVQGNLQFVRTHIHAGKPPELAAWRRILGKLSLNEWALACGAAFWLWFALLCLGQWRESLKRALSGWTATVGFLAACLGVCLGVTAHEQFHTQTAIVTVKESTVRYGPLEESQTAFTVRDGMELAVLDHKDHWLQVATPTDQIGWLPKDKVLLLP
ncbi:MAG: tetratricopeptide repeat protein [Verrucomicrobiota bacterium]